MKANFCLYLLAIGFLAQGCVSSEKSTVAKTHSSAERAVASVENRDLFAVPKKTSAWLYGEMSKSGKFPDGIQSSPQPAYKGLVNCSDMNSMGATPGGISCQLMNRKNADVSKTINVPTRSSNWLFSTMDQSGDFADGTGGPAAYFGYLNCSEIMSDPGNAASAYPSCELSVHEITE